MTVRLQWEMTKDDKWWQIYLDDCSITVTDDKWWQMMTNIFRWLFDYSDRWQKMTNDDKYI